MWLEIEIMEGHHEHWVAQYAELANESGAANVPEESRAMMKKIFLAYVSTHQSPSRPGVCKTKLILPMQLLM
jgi:hypothetical protein